MTLNQFTIDRTVCVYKNIQMSSTTTIEWEETMIIKLNMINT